MTTTWPLRTFGSVVTLLAANLFQGNYNRRLTATRIYLQVLCITKKCILFEMIHLDFVFNFIYLKVRNHIIYQGHF